MTTLLLWHASRIALHLNEFPAGWAPISQALSHLFGGDGATRDAERVLVWAHVLGILSFLAYLPYSKHLHIATAGDQRLVRAHRARAGASSRCASTTDADEEELRFGAGTVADLTWKEMLDGFSCTECGRCQDACPAFATGKALSPKLLIMGLRDQVFADGPALLAGAASASSRRSSRAPSATRSSGTA